MTQDFAILKRIYNTFDPFRPLPAGDPAYVDCSEVRGDGDILIEVGRENHQTNFLRYLENLSLNLSPARRETLNYWLESYIFRGLFHMMCKFRSSKD